MLKSNGNTIIMAEDDFGLEMPVTVEGLTLTALDTLKFVFKDAVNGNDILVKEYTPSNNAVVLEFSEAESGLFAVGNYVYRLDWYQSGQFMCNLIPVGIFRVVDKA